MPRARAGQLRRESQRRCRPARKYGPNVQQADAPADHAEDSPGEEGPRFGVGVPVGMKDAFLLAAPDHVGHEVVDLAHVAAEVLAELGVLGRLAEGLHPELGHLELAVANRHVAAAHRLEGFADVVGRLERPLPRGARLSPHVIERREVEVALRGEVTVEDRLGDARRAGDLRRRRAPVAPVREDLDRRRDQRFAALGRRQANRARHAASSASTMCARSTAGFVRTRTIATAAAANAITALTSSAACRPSTNC